MKKPIIIPLILLIIAILVGPYIAGNLLFSVNKSFEINWGISVPDGFQKVYHVKTAGFHGDGGRFSVFEAKGESDPKLSNFEWGRNTSVELFVNTIMADLEVPKDKRPASDDYYWKSYSKEEDGSSMIIIYSPEDKRMYFVEKHL